jgi:acyl-[acyl-carrier-protein] desaturase
MGQVFERDPEGGVIAFRTLLRGIIAMPGQQMADGKTPDLYDQFASISQRLGTYTARDYARIIGHLVATWRIPDLSLSGKAAKAQDYLCVQAERYELYADAIAETLTKPATAPLSWIRKRGTGGAEFSAGAA